MEVTVPCVVCLLVFLYICYTYLKPGKRSRLPPGPRSVPIFGNALQFSKDKFMLNMADVGKDYGDAYTIKIFNEDYVVLNSYDVIKEVLNSPKYAEQLSGRPPTFVGSYVMKGDEVFSTYSAEWVALRKLVMRGLKTYGTHLKDVEDLVQTEMEHLIGRIGREGGAGRSVDPFVFISGYITSIVSMLLTGVHLKQEDENLKLFADILDSLNYLLSPQTSQLMTSLPLLRHIPLGCGKVYQRLQKYRARLNIDNANEKRTEDAGRKQCFLDFLLEEKSRGNISEDTVSGVMMNLLMAGVGTSRTALYSMILVLTAKPEVQRKIQKEVDRVVGRSRLPSAKDKNSMPYTQAVMWETFRLYPSIPITTPRCTMEDVIFRGYFLPENTMVFYNIWGVLHDGNFWDSPWDFKPSRFLDNIGELIPPEDERRQRMIAFGVGKRSCLGEVLARLRIFLACAAILQKFDLVPDPYHPLPDTDPRTFDVSGLLTAPQYNIIFKPRELD